MKQRIAIVGSGISGLTAAYLLSRRHDVVLYEAEDYIGGHTHTITVKRPEGQYEVDTGFIVFNDRTYPGFNRLLDQLGVERQPTEMGFSVSCRKTGLEYSGDGLGGLFAQRRNLVSPRFLRMLLDIVRFNRRAPALADAQAGELPLGDFLRQEGYSDLFRSHYIMAMGGSIWSAGETLMENFPARFFVRFFRNHGLLSLTHRPQWYVIRGGSARYVEKLLPRIRADIRTQCPVLSVSRDAEGVTVTTASGSEHFDQLVMACHSDQALRLLSDASQNERAVLSAIRYQSNDVVLHTDTRLLPRNRRTWSSWNHMLDGRVEQRVRATYNMNILQGIEAPVTFCVTLNATDEVDPNLIIGRYRYDHPVFTPEAVRAQASLAEFNGDRNTWYCGAWCRNGFHEDGVQSALAVARHFGESLG